MIVDGGGARLRVAVLGPLHVERDGHPVRLGPKLVNLLSVLVLEGNRSVPATRLIDLLWGPVASSGADATLRSHISHLRGRLGLARLDNGDGEVLATVGTHIGAGYRLDLAPERVDARIFERELAEGRRLLQVGGDTEARHAAALLRDALGLWRGPAFADVADRPFASSEIARLGALHRSAVHSHAEALFSIGRYAEVVSELTGAVAGDPYDEGLRHLLARALYAEHRVDEAAEVCREGLTLLQQRGLDAPELQELQRGILSRKLSTLTGSATPHLLPPEPAGFVGRVEELKKARRLLSGAAGRPETLIVTGPAGIGKTSFAIRVSHAVADRFPDGQLYVNLRGFDPGGSAMRVAEAIRIFLTALGVPPQRIPEGLDNQVALYRGVLADRRMLIVLDNARDADQVRPLLPGSIGCPVIVTSRSQLASLVTTECAVPLTLDLLSVAEARRMLRRRLGTDRADAEPEAVTEVINHCARLPLTLAVAAARAATYPDFSLAALAAELREPRDRLDALTSVDAAVDVRTVFSWSYNTLSWPAARLFRLLAVHPGPDITTRAAASLVGAAPGQVRAHLAELTHAHLVTEHRPGRYVLHDMLRAYAAELINKDEATARERRPAGERMLGHYLQAAYAGALLINPHPRDQITPVQAVPGVCGEDLHDRDQALAWFTAEHAVLMAVVRLAASPEFDAPVHTWQLTWAMVDFLDRRGYWHDWADLENLSLRLAQRLGDPIEQARAHRQLGLASARLGGYADADTQLRRALELFGDLGHQDAQAHVHHNLAWLLGVQGRHDGALEHAKRALDLFRPIEHRVGQGRALNAIGWSYAKLGDLPRAVDHCRQAITLLRACGDALGEAGTWDSLGYAYHRLADFGAAIEAYRCAIEVHRTLGDQYGEAVTLERLGDAYQCRGDLGDARRAWESALTRLDALGHPKADAIRARLHVPEA